MRKHIGWFWVIGFFGLLAAANAQAPSPPTAGTQFDGTYAFVSVTKVIETFSDFWGRMKPCLDMRTVGSLTIANGPAQYSTTNRYQPLNEGIIGSQGELSMRVLPTSGPRGGLPIEIATSGRIDGNGTVHARRTSEHCQYDVVWQKRPS